jgi:signal transduction histidine kinase
VNHEPDGTPFEDDYTKDINQVRTFKRRFVMQKIHQFFQIVNNYFSRYPAVLSGYVIYSYLFVSIMQFYVKAKMHSLSIYDIFAIFSALPFMWFLSVALVKIIDVRTKLDESERQRILAERELEIHQAQLQAMQETVRGLQHYINDPLTVISLSMDAARKAVPENKEVILPLTMAEKSLDRIHVALSGFSAAKQYITAAIDSYPERMVSLKGMLQIH